MMKRMFQHTLGESENEAQRVGLAINSRPGWKDPRFAVGIILVALAVALGTWVVSLLDARTTVWAAAETLTEGSSLQGKVVEAQVHPDVAGSYLPASKPPSGIVTRTIGAGELIANSAIASDNQINSRAVVIPLGTALPHHAKRGTIVDVWFVPANALRDDMDAHILARGAIIEQVHETASVVARQHGAIEVRVAPEDVGKLLAGIGGQGFIAVVPLGDRP